MLCFQVKGPNIFLEKWNWNTSKCQVMGALKSWNWLHLRSEVWEGAREKQIYTIFLRNLGIFLSLCQMNLPTSVQKQKCLQVRDDRKCRCREMACSILGRHIAVPYGRGEAKHMACHLQDGAGWVPWMAFNASRLSLIWSASKGQGKPVTQMLLELMAQNKTHLHSA